MAGPQCEERPDGHEWLESKDELKTFLKSKEGSPLKAWLKHFDANNDQRITFKEFADGMAELNYNGDVRLLFDRLDADHSGELALEEVDQAEAIVWRSFRSWASRTFGTFDRMVLEIGGVKAEMKHKLRRREFKEGLQDKGWEKGCEDLIFDSLCDENTDAITEQGMQWLEVETARCQIKEGARKAALTGLRRSILEERSELHGYFVTHLHTKYGSLIKAWRCGLCPKGGTRLFKLQFFKACTRVSWSRSVRDVWKAFDKDDEDCLTMDELDPPAAQNLALLREWAVGRFGSCVEAFRALDRYHPRGVRLLEFQEALQTANFPRAEIVGPSIFQGLDQRSAGRLCEDDFLFMDDWRPAPHLLATANELAKRAFLTKLVDHYRHYLRAWRRLLDRDGSNRCTWPEFEGACKKLEFKGDIAGAWRAFDDDLSGYISLAEIDPVSSQTLLSFRRWADSEFGSVKSLLEIFDSDHSNEISYREFRHNARIYGFDGNVHELFRALDVERNGALHYSDVKFLDDWRTEAATKTRQRGAQKDSKKGKSTKLARNRRVPAGVKDSQPEEPDTVQSYSEELLAKIHCNGVGPKPGKLEDPTDELTQMAPTVNAGCHGMSPNAAKGKHVTPMRQQRSGAAQLRGPKNCRLGPGGKPLNRSRLPPLDAQTAHAAAKGSGVCHSTGLAGPIIGAEPQEGMLSSASASSLEVEEASWHQASQASLASLPGLKLKRLRMPGFMPTLDDLLCPSTFDGRKATAPYTARKPVPPSGVRAFAPRWPPMAPGETEERVGASTAERDPPFSARN